MGLFAGVFVLVVFLPMESITGKNWKSAGMFLVSSTAKREG